MTRQPEIRAAWKAVEEAMIRARDLEQDAGLNTSAQSVIPGPLAHRLFRQAVWLVERTGDVRVIREQQGPRSVLNKQNS